MTMQLTPNKKATTMSNLLFTTKSRISGKNADVNIYSDRIEWAQQKSINWWLVLFTCGLWLLVPRGQAGSEMIPTKRISSVITDRKNPLYTTVTVVASGNTLSMTVNHDEAEDIKRILSSVIL